MASISWVKLNIGIFENVKIKNLDVLPLGDTYFRIWINLLVLAGKTNDGGLVYFTSERPHTNKTLAAVLNKPVKIVAESILLFQEFKMIEVENGFITILNWEKYQNLAKLDILRENGRDTKRRQRERQATNVQEKSLKSHSCHDTALALALAVDKEEEKDKEKDKEKIKQRVVTTCARENEKSEKSDEIRGEINESDSELFENRSFN